MLAAATIRLDSSILSRPRILILNVLVDLVDKVLSSYLKLLVVWSWHNTETSSSFVLRYEISSSFELAVGYIRLPETTSSLKLA